MFFLCIVLAYLAGSIPFGLLIGKVNKINIREHGSGNIGATNVLRTLGKKWGYICFILDFLKGLLPVTLLPALAGDQQFISADYLPVMVAVITVLGHIFSCFVNFKGGKGIATSAGAIVALAPLPLVAGLVFWFIVFKTTRYVSLASILAGLFLPIFAVIDRLVGISSTAPSDAVIGLLCLLAILVTVTHKANIKRLLKGEESRFAKKEKK